MILMKEGWLMLWCIVGRLRHAVKIRTSGNIIEIAQHVRSLRIHAFLYRNLSTLKILNSNLRTMKGCSSYFPSAISI
ncbi:hypothetical protein BC830DRAFT_1104339, partial [Chytriomyces sp. MP71]